MNEPRIDELTEREQEVVRCALEGMSVKDTARRLGVAPTTIRVHRLNAYKRLCVNTTAQLFIRIAQMGNEPAPATVFDELCADDHNVRVRG